MSEEPHTKCEQIHALLNPLLDWLYSEPLLTLSRDPGVIQSTLDICTFAWDENESIVMNLIWKHLLRFQTALSGQKVIAGECITLILRSFFVDGFGHLQRSYSVDMGSDAFRFPLLGKLFFMSENSSPHIKRSLQRS